MRLRPIPIMNLFYKVAHVLFVCFTPISLSAENHNRTPTAKERMHAQQTAMPTKTPHPPGCNLGLSTFLSKSGSPCDGSEPLYECKYTCTDEADAWIIKHTAYGAIPSLACECKVMKSDLQLNCSRCGYNK